VGERAGQDTAIGAGSASGQRAPVIRQYELVERVRTYDPQADEDLLNKAYVFTVKAHGSQLRASGDPYFSHPVEVAGLLTTLKLDGASIITGLLHDTVEDTLTTLEEIQRLFGPEVARLVDGVTKLSRIELQNIEEPSDQRRQAENFRKLVLAMSEDIRVLLVKLADRLHNMRTLHYLKKPEKRRRIARETIEIYAPLAERIGIQRWKDELEELSFRELNQEAHDSIQKRLDDLALSGAEKVERIIDELRKVVHEAGLPDAQISGRRKSPYSIWRKMQQKNVPFEQLSDVMAFRIVVDSIEQCYQALGTIHARYPVVPGRFKDYISTPKPNGYRSIHSTVIGPQKLRIEVQIRTREMHEVADVGVAAHWAYKQSGSSQQNPSPKTEGRQYRWLRELLDILEHATRPEEFLEHTKLELFQDQVFCFTPKGDLIALPRGATPVDFAYAVHSQIGDTCVGAKVNGKMLPLRSELNNGDQVEILVSKNSTPSPDWENFVATGKARARIRRFVRNRERSEHIKLGRGLLERVFHQEGYEYSDKALDGVLKIFQQPTAEDLLAAIGAGQTGARDVFNSIFPGHRTQPVVPPDEKVVNLAKTRAAKRGGGTPLAIRGLIPGMAVHHARCCHPLPGDRIVGIVTTGKGVTIHTIDCETLESFHDTPERWIDVAWDTDADQGSQTVGRLFVVLANETGALGTLSTVIGKNGGNITNLKITSRTADFFEMLLDIDVHDVKHLTNIMAALRATPVVQSVDRARGR